MSVQKPLLYNFKLDLSKLRSKSEFFKIGSSKVSRVKSLEKLPGSVTSLPDTLNNSIQEINQIHKEVHEAESNLGKLVLTKLSYSEGTVDSNVL